MKRTEHLALILCLAAAAFAGCGGEDGTTATLDSDVRGSPQLHLEADPDGELAYTAEEAVASEGNVAFVIENSTTRAHTVAVEDQSGKRLGRTAVAIKGEESFTITMKAGTYTYYCVVPGHREGGMEGTLTVEPG